MKPDRKLWRDDIQPIVDYCQRYRGTISLIHAAYERALGHSFERDSIQRWLMSDAKRRIEPRYGTGLLLVRVAREVILQDRRSF